MSAYPPMPAQAVLDATFLQIRARALECAAAMDRLERAPGSGEVLASDPRVAQLREAFRICAETDSQDRAVKVLQLFSLE